MKKSLLFFFFLFNTVFACELTRPVVSLSSAITHTFYQLELFNDSKLMAIGQFDGFTKHYFKKDILLGGNNLSSRHLEKYKNSVLFYDHSIDLERTFSRFKKIEIKSLKTRGETPFQVIDQSFSLIKPYIKGCEQKIADLRKKVEVVRHDLIVAHKVKRPYLFFLGSVSELKRLPNMLMNRDGFVLSLIEHKVIESYPSKLAYVSWSAKEMRSLKNKDTSLRGLVINDTLSPYEQKVQGNNIETKTGLLPGWGQLFFLHDFLKGLK